MVRTYPPLCRRGFSYLDTVISLVILSIVFLAVVKVQGFSLGFKEDLISRQRLSDYSSNIIEALRTELGEGREITGYSFPSLPPRSSVTVEKEFVCGEAVYLVHIALRYRGERLEKVVLVHEWEVADEKT